MQDVNDAAFERLASTVRHLLQVLERLQSENQSLVDSVSRLEASRIGAAPAEAIGEMEVELQQLRKQNKILKEREKLISIKMERLAAKLGKIEA